MEIDTHNILEAMDTASSPRPASETESLLNHATKSPSPSSSNNGSHSIINTSSFLPQCLANHPLLLPQIEDRDALYFGIRMSVCLTASSLFSLGQVPDDAGRFHEGMWVLITVLFVCWFPTLDAASVLEKSLQRLYGTFIGAFLGLACGFLSLLVEKSYGIRSQAVFLGGCIALVSFAVCSLVMHLRVGGPSSRSSVRLIEVYNYATILCLLTFTICLMPFYSMSEGQWHKSIYRVINVFLGCLLGVGLSMMVFPKPTLQILQEKISKQIQLAGEASEAVLHTASEIFAEETYVPMAFAEEILSRWDSSTTGDDATTMVSGRRRGTLKLRMPSVHRKWRNKSSSDLNYGHDVVLEKYDAATKEWRLAKAQLGKLKYDPFNIGRPNDLLDALRTEVAQTLARAMRIQTTVVLMDGIVRNDPKHKFDEGHLDLLANVGTMIHRMLSVPLDVRVSDGVAEELTLHLVEMRKRIVDLAASVSKSPEKQIPSVDIFSRNGHPIGKSSVDLASYIYDSGAGSGSSIGGNNNINNERTSTMNLVGDNPLDDKGGTGVPHLVQGSHVCSLLFLQLVEHLALRSLRLYQSWKQYEGVCRRAESMRGKTASMQELEEHPSKEQGGV